MTIVGILALIWGILGFILILALPNNAFAQAKNVRLICFLIACGPLVWFGTIGAIITALVVSIGTLFNEMRLVQKICDWLTQQDNSVTKV